MRAEAVHVAYAFRFGVQTMTYGDKYTFNQSLAWLYILAFVHHHAS